MFCSVRFSSVRSFFSWYCCMHAPWIHTIRSYIFQTQLVGHSRLQNESAAFFNFPRPARATTQQSVFSWECVFIPFCFSPSANDQTDTLRSNIFAASNAIGFICFAVCVRKIFVVVYSSQTHTQTSTAIIQRGIGELAKRAHQRSSISSNNVALLFPI